MLPVIARCGRAYRIREAEDLPVLILLERDVILCAQCYHASP